MLDAHDAAAIEKTKLAAGIKPADASSRSQEPASAGAAEPKQVKSSPPDVDGIKLTNSDLRPLIAPSGQLAAALTLVLNDFDPVARQHIKPVSLLKKFMDRNDAALAKMMLEQHGKT